MLSEQVIHEESDLYYYREEGHLLPKEGIMMSNNHVQQNENQIDENQNEQMKHEYSSKSRVPFSIEEGQLLLDLYARYWKKWKEISLHFVNRTATSLKTHLEILRCKTNPI